MSDPTERAELIREEQRKEWTVSAAGWERPRKLVTAADDPVTDALLALAGIGSGQRVLDLACGNGNPGLAIAGRVGAAGQVLGLDLSDGMVNAARAVVQELNIRNAEFRTVADELHLDVPPASFDAATCRFGLMFMPDPAAALRAVHAALKPGGRVAVSTWGDPARVAFIGIPYRAVLRHVPIPPFGPGTPGPLALSSAVTLRSTLEAGGFVDVEVTVRETITDEVESPAAFWDHLIRTAGPLRRVTESVPAETVAAIRADVIETLQYMFPEGPVRLKGEALVAAGRKA
ncbi:MAG TPA: methyltransferase domain-containing protein [Symbiobacteriaceae bacterium]|nr:methyltransferase domain-containing protein [Symbiobacteriaceae bacterium]